MSRKSKNNTSASAAAAPEAPEVETAPFADDDGDPGDEAAEVDAAEQGEEGGPEIEIAGAGAAVAAETDADEGKGAMRKATEPLPAAVAATSVGGPAGGGALETIPLAPEIPTVDPRLASARQRLAEVDEQLATMRTEIGGHIAGPTEHIRTAQDAWRRFDAEYRRAVAEGGKLCGDLRATAEMIRARLQKSACQEQRLLDERAALVKAVGGGG